MHVRSRSCLLLLVLLAPAMLFGCGDDSTPGPDAGDDGGTGDGGGPPDPVLYDDPAPTSGCAETPACDDSFQVETACVCVNKPLLDPGFESNLTGCDELTASGEVVRTPKEDFCSDAGDSLPIDIGCMMDGMYNTAGPSQMVTVYGVIDVFGNGGDAEGIRVEIYREGTDGTLGDLVGEATSDITSGCAESEDEISHDMVIDTRLLGYYEIANVPTETPLIVKTSGDSAFWRDLYTYNIYIPDDEIETGTPPACDMGGTLPEGDRWEYRGRIISVADWVSIPLTAGQPEGIRSGSGVVGGEVHDCNDTRVEYAQVQTNPAPITLAYFNDNPDNPLPVMGRTEGTSLLGLYAALDIREGPVDVAAVGQVDGRAVSLGWYRARVFDGAVTVVTLRGLRPFQTE